MRLDFFLLADWVEVGEGGKLTIRGAEVTRISGTEMPVTVGRLAAVATFLIDPDDAGTEPSVRMSGRNPDGATLFHTPGTVPPPEMLAPQGLSEGEEVRLSFIVQLDGLEFSTPGQYTIEVLLNDEVVGSRALAVVVEPAPEAAANSSAEPETAGG